MAPLRVPQENGEWLNIDDEIRNIGGSGGVGCVLSVDGGVDVKASGDHPFLWDALYDNIQDFNALNAIPDGLGLSFLFDGSSADITTTAAGVWAFTYNVSVSSDATWAGALDTRFGGYTLLPTVAIGPQVTTSLVVGLPGSTTFGPLVSTSADATSSTYAMTPTLVIVRVA